MTLLQIFLAFNNYDHLNDVHNKVLLGLCSAEMGIPLKTNNENQRVKMTLLQIFLVFNNYDHLYAVHNKDLLQGSKFNYQFSKRYSYIFFMTNWDNQE